MTSVWPPLILTSLSLCSQEKFSTFESSCDYIGSTHIIPGNLPVSRPIPFSHLQSLFAVQDSTFRGFGEWTLDILGSGISLPTTWSLHEFFLKLIFEGLIAVFQPRSLLKSCTRMVLKFWICTLIYENLLNHTIIWYYLHCSWSFISSSNIKE